MKYTALWILVVFGGAFSNAQSDTSNIQIDTLSTLSDSVFILYTIQKNDHGTEKLVAQNYSINGQTTSIFDTIIILSKSDEKTVYFEHSGQTDEIYTLVKGAKFQNRHSDYTLLDSDKVQILKQIYQHIQYPKKALARGISGRVELNFYINQKGCIEEILVRKSRHELLTEEAIRAARKCDCKFPVYQNTETNKTLPTTLLLPISFRLTD